MPGRVTVTVTLDRDLDPDSSVGRVTQRRLCQPAAVSPASLRAGRSGPVAARRPAGGAGPAATRAPAPALGRDWILPTSTAARAVTPSH